MGNAAKIDRRVNRAEAPIDVSRARLVRRGQVRSLHLTLRAMREAAGLTQAQVEKRSGLKQPEISKLEAESSLDERQVSTVRRYLAALGDELELVSVSKHGHRIGVAPVAPEEGAPKAAKPEVRSVVVPQIDAKGEPMTPERVASWHLLNAARLLLGAYGNTRGIESDADHFAKASDVAMQLYLSLRANASIDDQKRLREMAGRVEHRTKTKRTDAEIFMLTRLPKTVKDAKATGYDGDGDDGGAIRLAEWVLCVVAAQRHADAGKVLRRWGVQEAGVAHRSSTYAEDCKDFARDVALIMLGNDDEKIAEKLLRGAYRVLGLSRALDGVKTKRRRRKARLRAVRS